MNLYKIYSAWSAVCNVYKLKIPYAKARKVMQLREKIKQEGTFYEEQAQTLADEYGKPADGKVSFDTPELMQGYIDKINELRNTEVDWDLEIITITDTEIGNQSISGEDIENLAPFITFGGD